MYELTGWNLDELLPSLDESVITEHFDRIEEITLEIEAMRDKLSPGMSAEDFARCVRLTEAHTAAFHRVHAYATLRFSADTRDQKALAFMGIAEEFGTRTYNRILFLSLWWKALDDEAAARLIESAGDARYSLVMQRLFARHALSEPVEQAINIKDANGPAALSTIYDMITSKYAFTLNVDGEEKALSRDGLMAYAHDPRADVREAAYRELHRVYENDATVLGQIYVHRVRDWAAEQVELRGHASPIAVRNLASDIPDAVVETLLRVCREEAGVFHEYFKRKAGWLGVEKLRRFDLYAPITDAPMREIPYEDAVGTALEAFDRFSPEAGRLARRVFDQGHMDAEPRTGKRGGAFCYSVTPEMTPWVLANYTGEPRQVATLAHELGHAIHSILASEHSVLTFHSALPLAETASIFSEMMLTDHLIEAEADPLVRRSILAETIDGMYATITRQAFFVMFEKEAHGMVAEGRSIDDLHTAYMNNLRAQFGDVVDVDGSFSLEWVSIPHIFHTPFYCYAYSFGMLLSLALYSQWKAEGEAFVPRFMNILAHGGSASPAEILGEAGFDMADPEFWRGGFNVIRQTIGRLDG